MAQVSFDGFAQGRNAKEAAVRLGLYIDLHSEELGQIEHELNPTKILRFNKNRKVLKQYPEKILTESQIEKIMCLEPRELVREHVTAAERDSRHYRKINIVQIGQVGWLKIDKKTGRVASQLKTWGGKPMKAYDIVPIYLFALEGCVREYDPREYGEVDEGEGEGEWNW